MKNTYLKKIWQNSSYIFTILFVLLVLFIANVSAITWINWYGSNWDYSNPTNSFSWNVTVWSWETLTNTTLATLTKAVSLSNWLISIIIPNNTQIANSLWTTFNVNSIWTNTLSSLPLSLATNEQEVGKIKFWIDWVNLYFSKPVKIQIPVNTTDTTVKVFAKHAWISGYQTYSLTNIYTSNCNNGYASPNSNVASVSNGIATIYTCAASDFIATTTISTPSSSGGWSSSWWSSYSGWGWWSILRMDRCPDGDYSPSYYDRKCWTAPEKYNTTTGKNSTTKKSWSWSIIVKEVYEFDWKQKTVRYKWIDIVVFEWYDVAESNAVIAKKLIDSKKLTFVQKYKYVTRLNNFVVAKHAYDWTMEKNKSIRAQYAKQFLLLKSLSSEIKNSLK